MREYLQSKSLINGIDEENLNMILEKCQFGANEKVLEQLDVFENINEYEEDENTIKVNNNNVITFAERKTNSKEDEMIDNAMNDFDDLID